MQNQSNPEEIRQIIQRKAARGEIAVEHSQNQPLMEPPSAPHGYKGRNPFDFRKPYAPTPGTKHNKPRRHIQ